MAGRVARRCCFGERAEQSPAKQMSKSRGVSIVGRCEGVYAAWPQGSRTDLQRQLLSWRRCAGAGEYAWRAAWECAEDRLRAA